MNFLRKVGQSMVLINKLFKSCGTPAQLTGCHAAADCAVPAPKKMLSFFRSSCSLPLTLFCQLSDEATENPFSPVKKTKSGADCGNF